MTHNEDRYMYGLIIIDCSMKLLNGFKTVSLIRSIYESLKVPIELQPRIIGLISHPNEQISNKAYYHGFDEVLPKVIPLLKFSKILLSAGMIDSTVPSLEFMDD